MDSEWEALEEGVEKDQLWMEAIESTWVIMDCTTSYALSMEVEVNQVGQMDLGEQIWRIEGCRWNNTTWLNLFELWIANETF